MQQTCPAEETPYRIASVSYTHLLQMLKQADLFAEGPERNSVLDATVDGIRGRFGSGLLTRASLLPRAPGGSDPRDP